ncbi:lipopolysaccharide biosynthesis protein [Actinoplanes philippinensis]|uniref:lipopolysaccharide biosynthesis protein n=1 Tax=Actinoplanes philippinensis TaxID=35752 RepID=UPI0033F68CB3
MLITALRRLSSDSLARNSLLIMATTVSNGGLGYFYWMLAARAVPPNRIGTATALISAATAVSMIANLGAGHMFIQRLPGSDAATWSRIVTSGLFLASAATTATATAVAVLVPFFSGNFGFLSGLTGTAALTAAAVAVTLTTLLDNLYVAHRAGHGMLIRNLAVAAGKIVTLLAVLAAGYRGATAVLVSYVLPTLLISLAAIAIGTRRLRPSPRTTTFPTHHPPAVTSPSVDPPDVDPAAPSPGVTAPPVVSSAAVSPEATAPTDARAGMTSTELFSASATGPRRGWWRAATAGLRAEFPHVRTAVTGHHLINLTQAGPAALLPVLVTARLGPDANAHFYLAWMTASMLFMVSPAVASALYAERTNAAPVPVSRAAMVVLAMVGAPTAVLLIAGDRILALFSAGYAAEGGLLLQILVLAALPDAVANLAVAHWRSRNEFRLCRRLNLVRAVTCLALAWLLLPRAGVTGAGVAWLTGQTASALLVAVVALIRRNQAPAGRESRRGRPETALKAGSPNVTLLRRETARDVRSPDVTERADTGPDAGSLDRTVRPEAAWDAGLPGGEAARDKGLLGRAVRRAGARGGIGRNGRAVAVPPKGLKRPQTGSEAPTGRKQ